MRVHMGSCRWPWICWMAALAIAACTPWAPSGRWNPGDPDYEGGSDPADRADNEPVAPSHLAAQYDTAGLVVLSWRDNSTHETGHAVYRKAGETAEYEPLGTAGESVTTYEDTAISPETTYTYRVRAVNDVGPSAWSNEVTITTPRPADDPHNAYLASLVVSEGELDPTFDPAVEEYAVLASYAAATLAVTPTVAGEGATVTVDGDSVASGEASAPISIVVGDTEIATVVTAADGVTTKTYTLAVSRATPPSTEARLASLGLSAGILDPTFDPDISAYTVQLGLDATGLTVIPTVADEGATVTVNGGTVASGTASPPISLAVGDTAISIVVTAEDGESTETYSLAVRRGISLEEAMLKASNAESGDGFGIAVAVDGDTMVVGASNEDSNSTTVNGDEFDNSAADSGAAYVFVRSGSTWTPQAYLKASDSQAGDTFGSYVGICGDTIAVGAFQEDDGGSNAGAAHVFVRSGTTSSQEAYVKASNTDAGDSFCTVAIDGNTLAVGACQEDSAATGIGGNQANNSAADAGAVYVVVRSGTTWTQQAYIKASNTDAGDFFGDGVAISGDTLIVGARQEDSYATGIDGNEFDDSASNSGAAYVFVRSGTVWAQHRCLKGHITAAGDRLGYMGGAGVSGGTLVTAACYQDSMAADSGAVYVFR